MEKNYQNKNIPNPKKSIKELEKIVSTKFSNQFNSKSKDNNILELIMEVLIFNKDCHLVTVFKDYMIWDFIDEFLKRFYNREEGKDRIPRYAHFYRNYSKFFCKPTFRDFDINEIIQDHSEKRAELYYNQNFRNKKDKNKFADEGLFEDDDSESVNVSKSKIEKTIFNKTVKKSIDNTSLYSSRNNETFLLNVDKDFIDNQNILTKNSSNQSIMNIFSDFNEKKPEKEINENSNKIQINEMNKKIEENKNLYNTNINNKIDENNKENNKILIKKKDENKREDNNILNKIKEENNKEDNNTSNKIKEENNKEDNNILNKIKEENNNGDNNILNKIKEDNNKEDNNTSNKIKEENKISNIKKEENNLSNAKKEENDFIKNKKKEDNILNIKKEENKKEDNNILYKIKEDNKKEESKNQDIKKLNNKKEENKIQESKQETINKPLQLYKYNTHIPTKKNSNLISCTSLLKKHNSINEKNNHENKKKSSQNINTNKSTQNKSKIKIIENMKHMYIKSRNINNNMQFYTKNDTHFKNYDLLTNNGKKIINLIKTQNIENLLYKINKNEKESHQKNIYSIDNLLHIHHYGKNNFKINSTNNIHFSKKIQNKSANDNSNTNFLINNISKTKINPSLSRGRSYSNNNNQKQISPKKGKFNKNEELVKITLSTLLINNKGRNNSNNLKQLKTYKVNLSSNKNNPVNNNHSNNQFQDIISSKLNNRINSNEKINLNINSNLNQIFNNNYNLKISRNKGRNIDLIPNTLSNQFKSVSSNDKKMILNTVISKSQNKNVSQGKMIYNISSSQLINMGKLKVSKPIHLKQKSIYGSLNYKKKGGGFSYKK